MPTDIALMKVEVKYEHDVVLARQRARQIAERLGFDHQHQVRIATAVSELARNMYQYAGSGRIEYLLTGGRPQMFEIRLTDQGPGIADLQTVLSGTYVSKTGMGVGLVGAQRLMDHCQIDSSPNGTSIVLQKALSAHLSPIGKRQAGELLQQLIAQEPNNPFNEIQQQNQELLTALTELQEQREHLAQLNQELEETNRGVVALYAELDQRADYLRRASDLKTQFLSNMTHEFRTPLNSITSISQMLLDQLDGPLGEEQEKQVTYIRRAAKDLSVLVNDLLDLAKVEAGKVSVYPTQFDVEGMFGTLRGILKPLLAGSDAVKLIFEPADKMPLLETDEGKLSQILRNFIANGLKYTQAGEVRISAHVQGEENICFTVSDTGIGVAAENISRIFDEFVQVEGAHQTFSAGTGLGLSLSKRLAELLGGTVELVSVMGQGSQFSVTLPMHYQGALEVELAPATSESKSSTDTVSVLIIDDEETDRYVLRRMLPAGSHVVEATRGVQGIELAQRLRPDIIFVDLNMPEMSGFEVLSHLKTHVKTRSIPVVIHTSKLLNDDERRMLENQAAAIFTKDQPARDLVLSQLWDELKLPGLSDREQRYG